MTTPVENVNVARGDLSDWMVVFNEVRSLIVESCMGRLRAVLHNYTPVSRAYFCGLALRAYRLTQSYE